jgi:hypothetical protein
MVICSSYLIVFNKYLKLVQPPTLPPNTVSSRLLSVLQLSLFLKEVLAF